MDEHTARQLCTLHFSQCLLFNEIKLTSRPLYHTPIFKVIEYFQLVQVG